MSPGSSVRNTASSRFPWAGPGSRFTALFESLVIDWLQGTSITAVAQMLHMSWDEVDGVMQRAVERGLKRRESQPLRRIGIDETSFQKRHEYVTVVYDVERTRVIEVLNGRKQEDLENFFWDTPLEHILTLESVSMDMWPAYINTVSGHIEDPELKICFDRFHIAKHLGDGVNKVRTEETGELRSLGDRSLVGTRFLWLQDPENMTAKNKARFNSLRDATFKVARAWAMKEVARGLWNYKSRGWAKRGWESLISWMSRSRLGPMVKVAKMLRAHLWGVINAIVLKATNADLESTNAKIQALKKRACGYRNRDRFRHSILFHCGRLKLHPRLATHTVS